MQANAAATTTTMRPELCLNPTLLMEFFRVSRSADDLISTKLNSLRTAHLQSISQSSSSSGGGGGGRSNNAVKIPSYKCRQFLRQVIYPAWKERDQVISYCQAIYSNAPSPSSASSASSSPTPVVEHPVIVDQRLDPYSGRNIHQDTPVQSLQRTLQQEAQVEGVIRSRTKRVIAERCEYYPWDQEFASYI